MKPPLTVDVAHSPLIWTVGAASSTTTSSAKTGRAAGARSNTSEHNPARIRMPRSVVPGRCGGRDRGVTASSRTCDTLEYMRFTSATKQREIGHPPSPVENERGQPAFHVCPSDQVRYRTGGRRLPAAERSKIGLGRN